MPIFEVIFFRLAPSDRSGSLCVFVVIERPANLPCYAPAMTVQQPFGRSSGRNEEYVVEVGGGNLHPEGSDPSKTQDLIPTPRLYSPQAKGDPD